MQEISSEDIVQRIRLENPWWQESHQIPPAYRPLKPRAYFTLFLPLVRRKDVRRAIVLLGPRRVGKTVMIHQAIQSLIKEGVAAQTLCYLSTDHPIYNGLSLEKLLSYYSQATGIDHRKEELFFSLMRSSTFVNGKCTLKPLLTHTRISKQLLPARRPLRSG